MDLPLLLGCQQGLFATSGLGSASQSFSTDVRSQVLLQVTTFLSSRVTPPNCTTALQLLLLTSLPGLTADALKGPGTLLFLQEASSELSQVSHNGHVELCGRRFFAGIFLAGGHIKSLVHSSVAIIIKVVLTLYLQRLKANDLLL